MHGKRNTCLGRDAPASEPTGECHVCSTQVPCLLATREPLSARTLHGGALWSQHTPQTARLRERWRRAPPYSVGQNGERCAASRAAARSYLPCKSERHASCRLGRWRQGRGETEDWLGKNTGRRAETHPASFLLQPRAAGTDDEAVSSGGPRSGLGPGLGLGGVGIVPRPAEGDGCRVPGCTTQLEGKYHIKYRICFPCSRAPSIDYAGSTYRFCQQVSGVGTGTVCGVLACTSGGGPGCGAGVGWGSKGCTRCTAWGSSEKPCRHRVQVYAGVQARPAVLWSSVQPLDLLC